MTILGSVDNLSEQGATGWAFSPDARAPLTVQAVLDNRIVGESAADIYRPDLEAVGFGTGRCGFTLKFHERIDPRYLPFVAVKLANGDVEFPRTPVCGYGDFFRALFQRYPMAGRQHSVFGGLWTDRTDAEPLLRGRLAIGLIPPVMEPALTALIQHGVCRFTGIIPADSAEPTARAQHLIADPEIGRVLNIVLEDQPVVLRATPVAPGGRFAQPSSLEILASPGECLALLTPASDRPVLLDTIRGSHRFPEFSPGGTSRYLPGGTDGLGDHATLEHLVDTVTLEPGAVALIGAGTIFSTGGGTVLRVLCVPARQVPVHRLAEIRAATVERTQSAADHHRPASA